MHRYHPRFHLVQADDLFSVRWSVFQTFTFPETSFMAVTAYQNNKVSLGPAFVAEAAELAVKRFL